MAKQIKINAFGLSVLKAAFENTTPRMVPVIEIPKGGAKVLNGLVEKKLLVAVRADHAMLVVANKSLAATDAGFKAIGKEPSKEHGDDPGRKAMMAGVMAKSYHDIYMAQGGGCADTIDKAMKDAFLTGSRTVTTKGKDGKDHTRSEAALDLDAMRKWGKEIGLWNDNWDRLNPGMQRMNLTNRVRAAVRKGAAIKLKLRQGERKGQTIALAA